MQALQEHDIPRAEWERRFKARIALRLGLPSDNDDSIPASELESWPEHEEHPVGGFAPDWMNELPEDAADENLSNWTD